MKFILAMILVTAMPAPPYGLRWGEKYDNVPEVSNFRYWYGDMTWGETIHLGTKDLDGFETELHLGFVSRRLCSAVLILGPAGMNSSNCMARYKRVLEFMNEKYGRYILQRIRKDPIIDDLVAIQICSPVQAGLHEIETIWKTRHFRIQSTLYGDDEAIFIEIEYTYLNLEKKKKQQSRKKILERL